jgi:hypothetical protein
MDEAARVLVDASPVNDDEKFQMMSVAAFDRPDKEVAVWAMLKARGTAAERKAFLDKHATKCRSTGVRLYPPSGWQSMTDHELRMQGQDK